MDHRTKRLTIIICLAAVGVVAAFLLLTPPTVSLPIAHTEALRQVVPLEVWENSTQVVRRHHDGYLVELSPAGDTTRPVTYTYRVRDDLTVVDKQVAVGYGSNFPLNMTLALFFGCILLFYALSVYRVERRRRAQCSPPRTTKNKK